MSMIVAGIPLFEFFGWLAAGLTLLAFSARTMMPLRAAALGGNVCFISYGYLGDLTPVLALHAVLLPFNAYRLAELVAIRRRVEQARRGAPPSDWLKGLGRRVSLKAGEVLFHKGDQADRLYQIVEGEIELVEIGKRLGPGALIGEIAFFTAEGQRTLTARSATDCRLNAIDARTFSAIHMQNPAFGVFITRLIAQRLIEGISERPDAYRPAGETPEAGGGDETGAGGRG